MNTATFVANFFRQGKDESSTRLVGILGFVAGTALAIYVVVRGHASVENMAVVGIIYAQSMIALGLRKSPDAEGASLVAGSGEAKP